MRDAMVLSLPMRVVLSPVEIERAGAAVNAHVRLGGDSADWLRRNLGPESACEIDVLDESLRSMGAAGYRQGRV